MYSKDIYSKKETPGKWETNINNVINYISAHLDRNPTLEELSKVACFSRFHFHRIFKALIGETVGEFTRRLQLEKAAGLLMYNPSLSITSIALECGFSSSQNFSKAFKIFFTKTPSGFREEFKNSNPGNIISKLGKAKNDTMHYNSVKDSPNMSFHLNIEENLSDFVVIKTVPDLPVVYVRQLGEYTYDLLLPLFNSLLKWAGARKLLNESTMIFGVCWDYIAVTADQRCRYDACITIPADYAVGKEVNRQIIKGGTYGVYRGVVKNNNFHYHWNRFLNQWLPVSGFEPDNKPCFEVITNILQGVPQETYDLQIWLPLKK